MCGVYVECVVCAVCVQYDVCMLCVLHMLYVYGVYVCLPSAGIIDVWPCAWFSFYHRFCGSTQALVPL